MLTLACGTSVLGVHHLHCNIVLFIGNNQLSLTVETPLTGLALDNAIQGRCKFLVPIGLVRNKG